MRAKNKWSPRGILLWLIAAAAATLLVCSESRPETGERPDAVGADSPVTDEVEVEVVE